MTTRWLRIGRLRLRSLWNRRRVEDELGEELTAYFEARVAQGRAAGLDMAAARAAAQRDLGSAPAIADRCREAWGVRLLDELAQDVRYGVRMLARQPIFTVTAALSLAVCLGANTAIFTVANRLLFAAPAGVSEPGELVEISPSIGGRTFAEPLVAWEDYVEIRRGVTRLEGVYGYEIELRPMSLVDASGSERIFGTPVTNNYFALLGVRPALGRLFDPGDSEDEGAAPLVVLSHRFWTQRFHADPRVLGRTIRLTRQTFTVIGVAPDGFKGLSMLVPDVWIPAGMANAVTGATRPNSERGQRFMVGGRLKPEATAGQAAGEIEAIGRAIALERGRTAPKSVAVPPGMPGFVDQRGEWGLRLSAWSPIPRVMRLLVAGFMSVLLALVSIVLGIACANVAGVLLARATTRRREIAVRLAIGAGRTRLIRQLLTETTLLFALGGAAGLLLARLMTSLLVARLPELPVPIDTSFPLDGHVLAFTAVLSLVAAVACGLTPALRASRADVVSALKDDAMAPPDRWRLRSAFVVAQVAFSLLLVASAGLFVRSLERTTTLNHSFDPEGVEIASLDFSAAGYTAATGRALALSLLDRVRQIPGVAAASLAYLPPGTGAEMFCCGVTAPGVTMPAGQDFFMPTWNVVEPGYFATLRLPIVEGRDFNAADREGSQAVAVVDTVTAKRLWPGQSAIGRQLVWRKGGNLVARGQTPSFATHPLTVVGVVASLGGGRRGDEPTLAVYLPLQQEYRARMWLLARATQGQRLAAEMRAALSSLDAALPILSSRRLADTPSPGVVQLKLSASVAGAVGTIGVVLAAIGLYGLTAFVVARRTREIGVRIALGAEGRHVLRIVLREGMTLVTLGSAIGLFLAAGAGKLMARNFFGARALDIGVFGGAAALLLLVGLAACYVPARRATRIDPIVALRQD
jgi:predicted permease